MADTEMTNNAMDPEDLEDGEIESDCEDVKNDIKMGNNNETTSLGNQSHVKIDENIKEDEIYHSKSGKKKKSKNKDKSKDKIKKYSKRSSPTEDDFAGSIEKAIRKAMNKDDNESDEHEEVDERRKRKKKKKHDGKEGSSKKRKKQEYFDDVDENEMMCVRGASPLQNNSLQVDNDEDSYASDSSQGSREFRQRQRSHLRKNKGDRRRGTHPMQDPEGVCLYYMQGKCHKDGCTYSHDAHPPRKMELCKFYLMDCCAKREKCLYMHSDFPCKFYHTGLPCIYNKEECKFAHGKPLSEALRLVLLKHIESAPKEILGDFPRLSKGAATMIHNTQLKLMQEYGCEPPEPPENNIPSLFELNIPKPPNMPESTTILSNIDKTSPKIRQSRWQIEEDGSPKQTSRQITDLGKMGIDNLEQHKLSSKTRHSRWQNEDEISAKIIDIPQHINVLSIKNLSGVLTSSQISDLEKMGIDNLEQLGQLTVLQLNKIGISLKQITDIQLNTMNIQKLGLISSNSESVLPVSNTGAKDLDLRVPPVPPVVTASSTTLTGDVTGKDIDMRFQHATSNVKTEDEQVNKTPQLSETRINKDMIDIDQYTKDALKFATKEKEYNDNDSLDNVSGITLQSKDIDQRVLKFVDNSPTNIYNKPNENFDVKKDDTDIRFLQPEPIFKNPNKNHRRSTTDDEDNNLLIDEKWYSSDEDKPLKPKSQSSSPAPMSPHSAPRIQAIEPATVLSKLGDLSQFAISDEVTQLLNKMKNNLQDSKSSEKPVENNVTLLKERSDPRTAAKSSPEHKNNDLSKLPHKRAPKVSIYECIEGEPTDGRRRTDVDLRQKDFKLPPFGDTDLRSNTSGDIDLRLGLPFKPIPNYTPASEIDGSINSHPPIPYKVVIIDIPRPDYTDIRNSTSKSQALLDPRLRKVFRLSIDDSNSDSEKPAKPVAAAPRVDPRRKQKEMTEADKPTLDLSTILQNSEWYKDLSSTQKIYVNQNLASVTSMIKQHQQDKLAGNKLDLTSIQNNTVLVSIFANLGVSLSENAEFSYMPKPKEGLLKTPINYQGYGMPGPNFDSNNMNMMNMNMGVVGPMNNMNMGPMPGFNHPDPRGGPAPGLLGVAPNVPHNFDNNFGGHNNFGNMPFNGGNNEFGNMNPEHNFQRFSNRGGYRGRGNDRWNRGGPRGHRDRKGFDRGGWKGDRSK